MNKKSEITAKYDAEHTKRYGLKLNTKTDAAIIEKLSSVDSMQGYIKDLIRRDIAMPPFFNKLCEMIDEGSHLKEVTENADGTYTAVLVRDGETITLTE